MRLRPHLCGFDPPALPQPHSCRGLSGPPGSPPGPALDRREARLAPPGPPDLRLALVGAVHPGHTTDWSSEYAYNPNTPPSRPTPLILLPPHGARWLRWVVLMPTLPAR